MLIRGLKHWDESASRQPDHFVANSRVVAERIRQAYGRCAEVIHPPIDIDRFHMSADREDYYVVLSRLVSYKRIDLAVQACTERGKKLLVIGHGPDRSRLESMAGPLVKFLGRAPDEDVNTTSLDAALSCFPGKKILAWRRWKSQPQAGRQLLIAPVVRLRPSLKMSPEFSSTSRLRKTSVTPSSGLSSRSGARM